MVSYGKKSSYVGVENEVLKIMSAMILEDQYCDFTVTVKGIVFKIKGQEVDNVQFCSPIRG